MCPRCSRSCRRLHRVNGAEVGVAPSRGGPVEYAALANRHTGQGLIAVTAPQYLIENGKRPPSARSAWRRQLKDRSGQSSAIEDTSRSRHESPVRVAAIIHPVERIDGG